MKHLFLFLFLVILAPLSSALFDKPIYDGWVLSGKDMYAGGESFRVVYVENSSIVSFGNVRLVVNGNTCASEWIYRVCMKSQKFEIRGIEVPSDTHDMKMNVSVLLAINSTKGGMEVSRSFSSTAFKVNESVEVTTKLVGQEIDNISLIEEFNENFSVSCMRGCNVTGHQVFWQGDGSHNITYLLTPLRPCSYLSVAHLTYGFYDKTMEKSLSQEINVTGSSNAVEIPTTTTTTTLPEKIESKILLAVKEANPAIYILVGCFAASVLVLGLIMVFRRGRSGLDEEIKEIKESEE